LAISYGIRFSPSAEAAFNQFRSPRLAQRIAELADLREVDGRTRRRVAATDPFAGDFVLAVVDGGTGFRVRYIVYNEQQIVHIVSIERTILFK
jgi:hypothetical protein